MPTIYIYYIYTTIYLLYISTIYIYTSRAADVWSMSHSSISSL